MNRLDIIASKYEPAFLEILLNSDIDTLKNLYKDENFKRVLEKKYILDQLANNFGFKGNFLTFEQFLQDYQDKIINRPPVFNAGIYPRSGSTYKLDSLQKDLRWDRKSIAIWLDKLEAVQNAGKDIIVEEINHDEHGRNYPVKVTYTSKDGSVFWNDQFGNFLFYSIYTPDEKLFNFIIDEYNKLTPEEQMDTQRGQHAVILGRNYKTF